jgi:ribosomal protein L30/L7E
MENEFRSYNSLNRRTGSLTGRRNSRDQTAEGLGLVTAPRLRRIRHNLTFKDGE